MPCSQFIWAVGLALRANLLAPEAHALESTSGLADCQARKKISAIPDNPESLITGDVLLRVLDLLLLAKPRGPSILRSALKGKGRVAPGEPEAQKDRLRDQSAGEDPAVLRVETVSTQTGENPALRGNAGVEEFSHHK